MCGICGFLQLDSTPAAASVVAQMTTTLRHRGPDDEGIFTHRQVALGHRRLAILDVPRGRQPLTRDPLTLVYNGEVYNHLKLRQQHLPQEPWQTTCDTETLLALLRELGPEAVHQFRGMFALAVFDQRDNSLFLARDRLGIKPLYYFMNDRVFAFASEIKALLKHPEIRAEVNVSQLPRQLALKYTLDEQTLFRGIRKLLPGHWLRLRDGRAEIHQYWDLSYAPKNELTLADAASEFRQRFGDAVQSRLLSDVPLGVFLSGGIDSSVIAASMARQVTTPVRTFSIGFQERAFNELAHSRRVAEHIGAESRELLLDPQDWLQAWPTMVYHEDEPIAHPSSISLHFVSRLAAEDVKVVLTGEGADELLAGYERYYQTLYNLRWGKFWPRPLRRLSQQLLDAMPDRWVAKRKLVRTTAYLPPDLITLFLDNYAAHTRAQVAQALRPAYQQGLDELYAPVAQLMKTSDAEHLLDQLLYADMKTYLQELLMKQDQMSMSASLESRVPFLDHPLVEFACRLPTSLKLSGFATKRVLRAALAETVPPQIVRRGKQGFPTPTAHWFRGRFADTMRSLLLTPRTLLHEYVDRHYIEGILDRHQSGAWNMAEQIWTLGNLEIWLRVMIDGQPATSVFEHSQETEACVSCG